MRIRNAQALAVLLFAVSSALSAGKTQAQEKSEFDSVITRHHSVFDKIISVGTGSQFADTNTAVGFEPLWANTTGTYNSAFGRYALRLNDTGRVNTALGVQALFRNTSGSYNLAVGVEALANNISGVNNTAVGGYDTLLNNTTGHANTALGYAALFGNISGEGNVGLGNDSLHYNTTGAHNTGVGRMAGEFNNVGSLNTYVGFKAGRYGVSGSYNTYVGSYAGQAHTGSNNILIGAHAQALSPSGDNQLSVGNIIFGDLSSGTVMIGTGEDNGIDTLQVGGSVSAERFKLSTLQTPPKRSSSACTAGELRVTPNSIFVCVAKNRWRRAALTDF